MWLAGWLQLDSSGDEMCAALTCQRRQLWQKQTPGRCCLLLHLTTSSPINSTADTGHGRPLRPTAQSFHIPHLHKEGSIASQALSSSPAILISCSCGFYVNHQLMNNIARFTAAPYCSIHKSLIMSPFERQDMSFSSVWICRNGNSSTSSLGLADLEGFSDIPTQSTVNR